jgi:histone-lysine N-methyltransferase SETMAR
MLNSKEHVHHCLLYEYQMGHSAAQATRNICQFVEEAAMSERTAQRWFERFDNGDYSFERESGSGRPTELDLNRLKQLITNDPRLTVRVLASMLGCVHGTIEYHLKQLGFVSKLDVLVPHDLNRSQMQKRVDMCRELLSLRRNFKWLDNLITGDEKWVLYANIARSRQWLQPSQQPLTTPKADLHPEKRMISVWWDVQGVLYWELLPKNTTINAKRYSAQITKLKAAVEEKRPNHMQIYFQHDNARPHVAKAVATKLNSFGWELLPHPPYSPDIAPSDYHLFLSLSNGIRNRNFENEQELKTYLEDFFKSKEPEFYAKGIHDLPRRWQEIINSNGQYIVKK